MYEILFDIVRYSALARSSWLLVGLARMVPVHARARTRKWGGPELLALAELFGFLVLTWLLLVRPPALPAPTTPGWFGAVFGAISATTGVLVSVWAIQHRILTLLAVGYVLPVFLLYIRSEDRMMSAAFGAPYDAYRRHVGSILPRIQRSRT